MCSSGKGLGIARAHFRRTAIHTTKISSVNKRDLFEFELTNHGLQIQSETGKILTSRGRLLGSDR